VRHCGKRRKNTFLNYESPALTAEHHLRYPRRCSYYYSYLCRYCSLLKADLPVKMIKCGGKGIRTPDFQLAKLALYQLSYAPCEFSSLNCGLRIANNGVHRCRTSAVSANAKPDGDHMNRHPVPMRFFERAKLRSCAEKAALFSFPIVPREVPPNTLLSHR
jgi:hypothetical protein